MTSDVFCVLIFRLKSIIFMPSPSFCFYAKSISLFTQSVSRTFPGSSTVVVWLESVEVALPILGRIESNGTSRRIEINGTYIGIH